MLAGLIHRDIVDDVIRECGKREKRQRLLPAHVVMYYVLALNLFFGEAYEEVLRQLVNGEVSGELAGQLGDAVDECSLPGPHPAR